MILHEELASVGQRMVWLIDRYRGGEGRLNYPLTLRLRGPLDPAALQRALDGLVARHEALRTTFARRRGLLTQLVHAPEPVPVRAVALDADGLDEALRREATTSIDPTVAPMRVTLWTVDELDHVLCLDAHHLVTDAWSSRLLTDELVHLLADPAPLPRVPWQYRHYVRWQHRRTTAEQWRSDEEYWRAQLEGVRPPGPWHGERDLSELPGGATIHLDLDGPVTDRIGELARVEQATPFTVLLAFFYQALHQESGLSDLCVAAPFANRVRPETAGTVGLFANLVMLRTHLDGHEDGRAGRAGDRVGLTDLLRRTRRTVSAAMAHQEYPYYLLSAGTTGTRADRLDDVVFQMVPALPPPVSAGELEVEVLAPELHSRFDLELVVIPNPTGLRVRLQYARHRVADDVARRLADRYRSAVERTFAESVTPAP